MFRGSAAVAQLAVNQLVAGSNPALGAKRNYYRKKPLNRMVFCILTVVFYHRVQGSEITLEDLGDL